MLIFAGMEGFIGKLKALLSCELPGSEAQYKMAPELRLGEEHERYQNAAVLILLYQKNGQVCTVLMKRPEYPGAHSNQVSFPGGKFEKGDTDLHATALRETREELGIDDNRIAVLGELSSLEIPVSGIEVLPVVGHYTGIPHFNPDPSEVSYLIETPLTDLLKPDTRQEKIKTILCKLVKVPYYNINGNQVWGATAMILSEFLEILRKLDQEIPQ
jgi:8-oxo-dGTP pyrophosphatase MutT (NUDIX family)